MRTLPTKAPVIDQYSVKWVTMAAKILGQLGGREDCANRCRRCIYVAPVNSGILPSSLSSVCGTQPAQSE